MPVNQSTSRKIRRRTVPLQRNAIAVPEGRNWGNTTKLVVALSLFAIVAWLVVRFQNIVGLLIFSIVLAYLLYPVGKWLRNWSHFSWRWSVSIVFLLFFVLILGLFTVGGLAIVEQTQNLIGFLDRSLRDLPGFLEELSSKPIKIGPFEYQTDFSDLNAIGQYLLGMVQPLLGRAGSVLGTIAGGAANFLGLFFFTMLVAYFILAESGGGDRQLIRLSIPGYNEDFIRFGSYLSGIWNAFLRGQLTIIIITILVYTVMLGAVGLRFFIGLALLAGLARFVPYVGPAVAWTSYGLVAFFQGSTMFGLAPIWYVVLVVGLAWVTDLILDNLVGTRLMGNALKIHPAAVMVSALVGANLFGLVGVVLAAPVVATLKLVWNYMINRLLDKDPWYAIRSSPPPAPRPIAHAIRARGLKIWSWIKSLRTRLGTLSKPVTK
jgi:predicted PurR-regulated permease PerM